MSDCVGDRSGHRMEFRLAYPMVLPHDFRNTRIHVYWDGNMWRAIPQMEVRPTLLNRQAEYFREAEKLQRSAAGIKAKKLLREFLNDAQRAQLEEYGGFIDCFAEWKIVRDAWYPTLGDVYTMTKGQGTWIFSVEPLETKVILWDQDDTKYQFSFCWHPEEVVPSADIILGHYLFIKNNGADAFMKQANF